MDPKKDLSRRCIAPTAWPAPDRCAWTACLTAGDPLEPGGAGASWAPHTKTKIAKGYGRWLTWLDTKGLLDPEAAPGNRCNRARVARYLDDLTRVNAAYTVVARAQELYLALQAMAPDQDWCWIRSIERRLRRTARSVRNKRAHIEPSGRLFTLGLELMQRAEGPAGGTALQRAVAYRDALMISLLAARPFRRRNFCSIEIGRHLVCEREVYWLRFAADETKAREPIEVPFPEELAASLERYLTWHRPVLAERRGRWNMGTTSPGWRTNALWVSEDGSTMTEIAMYFRIRKLTQARFGHVISPHLFRDSAATSIAIEDPHHVHITRSILGHTTLRTSERHYNQARSLEALRRYQQRILELRRQARVANDRAIDAGFGSQGA
jgi:integrase